MNRTVRLRKSSADHAIRKFKTRIHLIIVMVVGVVIARRSIIENYYCCFYSNY